MICPHCQNEIPVAENCPQCGRILPSSERSHFQVFGLLEDRLVIDESQLEKRFFELSRKYHPDRFASKSPLENEIAHDYSAALNNAYRTLKDPVSRAKYVVERKLGSLEEKSAHVPPDMAEFFFEIHDALDMIRDSNDNPPASALKEVENAEKQLNDKVQELENDLESQFAKYDASGDQKELEKVREILHERSYIRSFLRQIDQIVRGGEPIIH
ncbi:MAG TPA: Fe-S protein assembly co-chaperone HscB [Acidobacteriota bacterium]|nr:Fe-S protein assembly co-chaperone HscB [Acidobacteriota bacterium]